MPLFIRDAEVIALVEEVQKLTQAKTKTEAVRLALQTHLAQAHRTLALVERLARAKAMADALGPSDPAFPMKTFSDEMWDDA